MSDNESDSHTNKFSRRKSKVQKEMDTCRKYVNENAFISVLTPLLPPKIGFTDMFIKFVASPDLATEFGTFMNKGRFSEKFSEIVLMPKLLDTVENEELKDSLLTHIWLRIFCKGRESAFNENAERAAYHRIQGKFKDDHSVLHNIRQNAFDLMEPEICLPEFASVLAQTRLLTKSPTVYYKFFPIIELLKNQLSETICMNTEVGEVLNIRAALVELFVRNQLLQFSKTNHSNRGTTPTKTKLLVKVHALPIATITPVVESCVNNLKKLNIEIIGSHKAFMELKAEATESITPSEDTITKTQLRYWVNSTLAKCGIVRKVKNSYDVVYCRILNHLGMAYDFSVRGNFRYPIQIDGIEPRPYTKRTKALRGSVSDPQTVLTGFDNNLALLKNKYSEILKKKRIYMENPIVCEYIKRQRMDDDNVDDDIMESIDDM